MTGDLWERFVKLLESEEGITEGYAPSNIDMERAID